MIGHGLGRSLVLAGLLLVGSTLAGCDYWPPALQSQIEGLKAELQMAAAEKTRLESQVKEAVKSRDEMQLKVDEMARINRELTGRVAALEQNLTAEREKVAKLSKPAAKATKATAKKKSTKPPSKKKSGIAAKKAR